MQINVTQTQERVPVTLLHLEGQFNLGSADQFEQQAQQAYAAGARYLLIDMEQVTSLTSAGLRSMLLIAKMLGVSTTPHAKSPYFKLLNPNPQILHVLNIAGFTDLFDLYTDQAQAVASF